MVAKRGISFSLLDGLYSFLWGRGYEITGRKLDVTAWFVSHLRDILMYVHPVSNGYD